MKKLLNGKPEIKSTLPVAMGDSTWISIKAHCKKFGGTFKL